MNYVISLINKIINNNYDFCCLCFKNIVGKPIRFEDEVCLLENELVGEILAYLLGQDILRDLWAFGALCEQCVTSAKNSYRFIKDCKQNTQYFFNVLEHLANCFDNTPQDLQDTKTLFVSLNPDLCTSNQYYDNKQSLTSCSKAFRRFETLTNLNLPKDEEEAGQYSTEEVPTFPKHSRIKNDTDSEGVSETEDTLNDKNDPNEIKCKECSRTFRNISNLKYHFAKIHGLEKAIKCPKCPKKFLTESLLQVHKEAKHAPFICTECGKTYKTRNILRTHEKGHYLRLVCQDCGRVYKNHNTFKKHIDNNICQMKTRHTQADAKYTCDHCQKKYSQKITLRVHMQYEHLNYKALECEWCGKKFWCKSRLNAHIVTHTKERNFVCSTCNGKFVTKESLLYHTRIHTGEKPYQCPHCNSRFLSASRKQAHVRTYHMDPTVECDICHSKFRSNHYLQKHKKVHSNTNPKVDSVSKRKVKYYYEIDDEGNLKLHSNPELKSKNKIDELSKAASRVEVRYQASESNQQVEQIDDENLYFEVVSDEEDYVIKVSENVEV